MPTPSPALPVPVSSPSPLTLPAFRRLVCAQVCFGIAYSTFLILPKYLTAHGVGPGRMGWVMATAALTNVVGLPLLTWTGRRLPGRSALVLGNILMAVGAGGFALLPPGDAGPAAFVLRAVQGLAWALVFPSAALMVMTLAPAGRLGEAIALHSCANLMTNAVGPALAEPGLRLLGPFPVFLAAAAIALAGARIAAGLTPTRAPIDDGHGARRPGDGTWAVLLLTSLVLGVACGAMLTFHQPLALQRGIGRVSDFLVAYTVGAVAVRLGLGRLTDRIGGDRVAFAALLLYAAVVAAMPGLAPGGLAVFGVIFGVAHGLVWPALLSLAMTDASSGTRQRLLTFINAGFNAGVASVGLLGLIAERAGYTFVFIPVGVLTAANAWTLRRWATRRRGAGGTIV